jgi:hypothetical protein
LRAATATTVATAGSKPASETFDRPNRIQREMRKIDTQLWIPKKQRK